MGTEASAQARFRSAKNVALLSSKGPRQAATFFKGLRRKLLCRQAEALSDFTVLSNFMFCEF